MQWEAKSAKEYPDNSIGELILQEMRQTRMAARNPQSTEACGICRNYGHGANMYKSSLAVPGAELPEGQVEEAYWLQRNQSGPTGGNFQPRNQYFAPQGEIQRNQGVQTYPNIDRSNLSYKNDFYEGPAKVESENKASGST